MRAILFVVLARGRRGSSGAGLFCSRTKERAVLGDGSCHLCTIGEGMIEEAESKLYA
jgi:hypothetical protein